MAIADTARLLTSLELKDNFTKGAKAAEASLGRLEKRVGGIGGKVTKGFKNVGASIKNALTGPLAAIGLGAGLLGLQQFLSGSVDKAQEFADAVMRVQAITGMATGQTSQLVDVLGDYGLAIDKVKNVAGIYEKTTGLLTKGNANYSKELKKAEKELGRHLTANEKLRISQKNAIKFQKEYGFQILDAQGKVKDFRTALLDAADFFTNKSIPATRKAAVMQKLFGRNWQELIPILKKGRAGLEETLGKGLTLTEKQQKALDKSRIATRNWQDALDELQIAIGVELLPAITRFQKRATSFIQEHGDEIVAFFRKAAHFAIDMGTAIKNDVLPVIGRIGDFWAALPDDLKKVLIGGFVLNKVTGGGVTGILGAIATEAVKGAFKLLGITAGVVNLKAGTVVGGGGVPGGPTTGGGIGSKVAEFGVIGVGLANLATLPDLLGGIEKAVKGTINLDPAQFAAGIRQGMEGTKFNPFGAATNALLSAMLPQLDKLAAIEANTGTGGSIAAAFDKSAHTVADESVAAAFGKAATAPKTDPAIVGALKALRNPKVSDAKLTARIDHAIVAIQHGATIDEHGLGSLERSIKGRLHDAIQNGDRTLARKLETQLGVLHAIRNKKQSVKLTLKQSQRQAIAASISSSKISAKPGFHYTKFQSSGLSKELVLAGGGVGIASGATPAIFGEAGREAFAILRNPRKGMLGGSGGVPIVNVHVNVDPRRITRKQTASGVYKTYVAT